MFFLSSNIPETPFEADVAPVSQLPELARANAHDMTGPVEILQLRNSADHTDNAFIIYENNISGTSYASFSSAEEIKVLSTFNANSMSPLHSHEYYEFLFVIDGEIYQNIEHDRHYYPAGGCCLVSPYVLHTEEYDTDCRVLFFKICRSI